MKDLQDMSVKELRQHKKKLLEQAENLKIAPCCEAIAKELGEHKYTDGNNRLRETYHWKQRGFDIEAIHYYTVHGTFVTLYVKHRGSPMLTAEIIPDSFATRDRHWEYTRYTPGNWVDVLLKKNNDVEYVIREREMKSEDAERQELIVELTPLAVLQSE